MADIKQTNDHSTNDKVTDKNDSRKAKYELSHVLDEERKYIKKRRSAFIKSHGNNNESIDQAQEEGVDVGNDQVYLGLALSGGGIRSATFNLGIIQALQHLGLLHAVDYLSTVSGGGYIGSWLSKLFYQKSSYYKNAKEAYEAVEEAISSENSKEIEHLREYANYLTPRKGILGLDLWSIIATYLRNLIVNWLVLVPLLVFVFLLPYLGIGFIALLNNSEKIGAIYVVDILLAILSVQVLLLSSYAMGSCLSRLQLKKLTSHTRYGKSEEQGNTNQLVKNSKSDGKLPFLESSKFVYITLVILAIPGLYISICIDNILSAYLGTNLESYHSQLMILLGLTYALYWVLAYLFYKVKIIKSRASKLGAKKNSFRAGTFALLFSSVVGSYMAYVFIEWISNLDNIAQQFLFVVPGMVGVVFITSSIHKGLSKRYLCEQQREWLNRLNAVFLMLGLVWFVVFAIGIYSPIAFEIAGAYITSAAGAAWLLSSLWALSVARSNKVQKVGIKSDIVFKFVPVVFVAGLFVIGACLAQVLMIKIDALSSIVASLFGYIDDETGLKNNYAQYQKSIGWLSQVDMSGVNIYIDNAFRFYWEMFSSTGNVLFLLSLFLVLVLGSVLVVIVSKLIDVNDYSLQAFYANRLARAYMSGDGHVTAYQDLNIDFTGFNYGDDLPLFRLSHDFDKEDARLLGPYHLVNTAVNLGMSKKKSWQERQAASYVFSPLFCGWAFDDSMMGFCKTSELTYKNQDSKDALDRERLMLSTAVATSGAAASPNMGYRTTPAMAFLMTFFNIRLGRWMSNPLAGDNEKCCLSAPKFAHISLLQEIFRNTDSKKQYLYLSDGGHFENLGVYELLRRKCRFIISVDAGCDPQYEYEDLGNLIRKARIDLGCDIKIDTNNISLNASGYSDTHCTVGKIHYEDGSEAYLLYIKASITGNEPMDILNYRKKNSDFPHQTTADQFFSESQFESYRRLGEQVGKEVFSTAVSMASVKGRKNVNIDALFSKLHSLWYPKNPVNKDRFTSHTKTYQSLLDDLRCDKDLEFLLPQFYLGFNGESNTSAFDLISGQKAHTKDEYWFANRIECIPSADSVEFRKAFVFCNKLIQLMEDVFLDLRLDDFYDHPDNSGWINLFRHWSWSNMFKVVWSISAANYGRRFRIFCKHHLGLNVGKVELSTAGHQTAWAPFNHYEIEQINCVKDVVKDLGGDISKIKVYALYLKTKSRLASVNSNDKEPEATLYSYCFGYMVTYDKAILAFRVQDHLRRMGLSREALITYYSTDEYQKLGRTEFTSLVVKKEDVVAKVSNELKTKLKGFDYTEQSMNKFSHTERSVLRELASTILK